LDISEYFADPAGLASRIVAVSSGLGVAIAGLILVVSLAVFIFERLSSGLNRLMSGVVRVCSTVLLVLGAALLEQALLVNSLGASHFTASTIMAAFVVAAVFVATRFRTGADVRATAAPPPAAAPASEAVDWRWVVQLTDLTDLTELQQFVVERLCRQLDARGGTVLLLDASGTRLEAGTSTSTPARSAKRMALAARAPLAKLARTRGEPIRRSQFADDDSKAAGVLKDLDRLDADIVVPLRVHGRLPGLIALGPCTEQGGYPEAAIARVTHEAEIIAVAIENARVHSRALQDKHRAAVLLEQLALGVLAADHTGTIIACNRAARRILALDKPPEGRPVSILGPSLAEQLTPKDAAEDQAARELVFDIKGRGAVPVRINAATVRGPLDQPGSLLLIEDLSERRALESELRRANRLASAGTLAAEMAHEIRNPLVSIKTFSQLLPERLTDQEFQLKFSQVAQREVDAISRIIDRVLNYAGPKELMRQPVRIEDLVGETLELLSAEFESHGITVEIALAPDSPPVPVDRDQVKQVLRNIMANAAQAMPNGGRLSVTTSTHSPGRDLSPDTCRVEVRDTGCGIAEEKLAEIYNPFFTTKHRGFGLGLSLARHVMEEHAGSIEISSTSGKGTTVVLMFPVVHSVESIQS